MPTEAEWEYAARSGKDNQVYPYDDPTISREKANFFGTAGNDRWEQFAPPQSFDPNSFGLHDMAGNVWELVLDFYSPDYYQQAAAEDPAGPSGGILRVARGGSYHSAENEHLRISYRRVVDKPSNIVGFRCVLPDTPEVRAQFKR